MGDCLGTAGVVGFFSFSPPVFALSPLFSLMIIVLVFVQLISGALEHSVLRIQEIYGPYTP